MVFTSRLEVKRQKLMEPERESVGANERVGQLGTSSTYLELVEKMERRLNSLSKVVKLLGSRKSELRIDGPDGREVERDPVARSVRRRGEEERLNQTPKRKNERVSSLLFLKRERDRVLRSLEPRREKMERERRSNEAAIC